MKPLLVGLLTVLAAGAETLSDVEFARKGDVSLTLDGYVPDGPGPFAAVVVVHGGGFINGTKQSYVPPLFEPLTKGGFAWFTINYRLAPQYRFPAAIEDTESAVTWVRQNAKRLKLDADRIALIGESAGAHIATFAATKKLHGVKAVVAFYGPHDFARRARASQSISTNVQAFLGISAELNEANIGRMKEASPITHVHPGMPNFLLIHGTADQLVPYDQSVIMCKALKAHGNQCELFTVEGAPHGIGPWEKSPEMQTHKPKMIQWLTAALAK